MGRWSERQYDDLEGVGDLTSLPDDAFHRNVDRIVIGAGVESGGAVRTCVVCPPTIYGELSGSVALFSGAMVCLCGYVLTEVVGKGRGPVSGRGRQVYELAKLVLEKGYTPIVGEGKARWNNVHIEDLSEVYRLLGEKAVAGDASDELWGEKGYILTENGEHVWSDLARTVSAKAVEMGYISDAKEGSLDKDEAIKQAGFEAVSWGLNSRGKAGRARKYLGWKPAMPSIEDEVPNILRQERERMGKV